MDLRDQIQSTLGNSYSVERELGGGGMSRVFVATESILGRRVVVKILPPETTGHVSVERFKREIKIAASLQHPHIVPLLAAGDMSGLPYYTMPFVKGESLRERLVKGGELSVKDAVHVLRDVAAALAYAHGEGVVHRDIKPENIILSGGVAVVTDFGVSKAVNLSSTAEGGAAKSGLTSLGVALGTPAYMAPEQASADPHVDHRADIYAFGIVAYEMLAGSSPFAGRPAMQMLSAHVTETPEPLSRRRAAVPPALSALVMKCLEKRAGDRPQSADELLNALDAIATPSGGSEPTQERLRAVRRKPWVAPAGVAAGLAVVATVAFLALRPRSGRAYSPGATIAIASSPDFEFRPAISPDGKLVAFVGGSKMYLRQIGGGPATVVPTDVPGGHFNPSWSPDGARISFSSARKLYVVATFGGPAKRVIEDLDGPHAWSPDGKSIAFTRTSELWVQSVDGGAPRLIVKSIQVHSPTWSPDGRFITYVEGNVPGLDNVSAGTIRTVPAAGGASVRLSDSTHVNLSPVWTRDGKAILYVSNLDNTRDVYQQAVRANGEPVGSPVRVTTSLGAYNISLSGDGTRLAYDVIRNYSNLWTFTDSSGPPTFVNARQITRDNQHIESLSLSHDGKWIAYDSDRDGNSNIYKVRIDGGEPVQLTSNPATEFAPAWSTDDREIAFHSNRTGSRDIYLITADGTTERQVTSGPDDDYFPRWLPDGRSLKFTRGNGGCCAIEVTTRNASGQWSTPERFAPTIDAAFADWSPDGATVALSRDNGAVALVSARDASVIREVSPASLGGDSRYVHWSRDGKTVFSMVYGANARKIVAIPASGGPPRLVLAADAAHRFGRWDFATDGKRFFFTVGQYEGDVNVMELRR